MTADNGYLEDDIVWKTHPKTGGWLLSHVLVWTPAPIYAGLCLHPVFASYTRSWVRCRNCEPCRAMRRRQWYRRSVREVSTAPKSWFVTLTFGVVPAQPYAEVQRWLKRLRSGLSAGAKVRYVCAAEYGAAHGRLHYHLLLTCSATLTRRKVENPWSGGFSKCTRVKPADIRYTVKYIGKHDERVHASNNWGKGWQGDGDCPF